MLGANKANEELTDGDAASWGDILLKGLSSVGQFIVSVESAVETAKYRKQLLSALGAIQGALNGIDSDLQTIIDQLKKLQVQFELDALSSGVNKIQSWGETASALDPSRARFAQSCEDLANQMMGGAGGDVHLVNAMNTIHDLLTGQALGSPLMQKLALDDVVKLQVWCRQGLNLLAFCCHFGTAIETAFGIYLWQWAAKLRAQVELFLSRPDVLQLVEPHAWVASPLFVADTLVLIEDLMETAEGVGLFVKMGPSGGFQQVYSSSLICKKIDASSYDPVSARRPPGQKLAAFSGLKEYAIDEKGAEGAFAFINIQEGSFSLDQNSELAEKCVPGVRDPKWLKVLLTLGPYGLDPNTFVNLAYLCSSARADASQTFLGAANGSFAHLDKDHSFIGLLFEGNTERDPMLAISPDHKSLSIQPPSKLPDSFDVSCALWEFSWAGEKGMIHVRLAYAPKVPVQGAPQRPYLSMSDGAWILSDDSAPALNITPSEPVPERMGNPLQMTPSTAIVRLDQSAASKKVLIKSL